MWQSQLYGSDSDPDDEGAGAGATQHQGTDRNVGDAAAVKDDEGAGAGATQHQGTDRNVGDAAAVKDDEGAGAGATQHQGTGRNVGDAAAVKDDEDEDASRDWNVGDTVLEGGVEWTVRSVDGPDQVTWEAQASPRDRPPVDPARPHVCQLCLVALTTALGLKRHADNHSGRKPLKCQQCGKAFARTSDLYRHQRTHNPETPRHKCSLGCTKSFTRKSDLVRHLRDAHTDPGAHRCQRCDAAFGRPDYLTAHERIHSGDRPFACKYCANTFALRGNCNRHERRHEVA